MMTRDNIAGALRQLKLSGALSKVSTIPQDYAAARSFFLEVVSGLDPNALVPVAKDLSRELSLEILVQRMLDVCNATQPEMDWEAAYQKASTIEHKSNEDILRGFMDSSASFIHEDTQKLVIDIEEVLQGATLRMAQYTSLSFPELPPDYRDAMPDPVAPSEMSLPPQHCSVPAPTSSLTELEEVYMIIAKQRLAGLTQEQVEIELAAWIKVSNLDLDKLTKSQLILALSLFNKVP